MTPQQEIQRLKDRIEQLEELIGLGEDDVSLIKAVTRLPPTACQMIAILRKRRGVVSKQGIFSAVYGERPECDQPVHKIVDVQICRARRGLAELGIKINTVSCIGLTMPEESRQKLTALMQQVMPIAVEDIAA